MSYDDYGYTRLTREEMIKEKEELYKELFDTINHTPSDIIWQWLKLSLYEREEIESLHEVASEMMSITGSAGAFLDKHGIECGIERKGETKSEGYVEVTKPISGVLFTIPAGTRFTSASNTYISDNDETILFEMEMLKGKTGESDDYFTEDIVSIAEILEIRDENRNLIDGSYYQLDPVYKNNVQWMEDSDEVLIENQKYYVYVNGNVVKRIEVSSELTGPDTRTSAGTVSTCVDIPTLSVTNAYDIEGGADTESDESYRSRLLQARRRTFTLGSIRDIINGLEGVRSCKVYQNTGVDQSSVDEWNDTGIIGTEIISGTTPCFSQTFTPGDQIATLGKITLRGYPYNDPPAIICGVKNDISDISLSIYHDYKEVEKYELDQSTTGMVDIEFEVKYNNLDKTKSYRFDVWCRDPEDPYFDWSQNYWRLALVSENYRSDLPASRGMLYEGSESGTIWTERGTGEDLMFKTHFNAAGFSAIISTEDGYGFTNIKTNVETLLDYIEEGGYSPICIQSTILESEEVLIDIMATIWISKLANFTDVRNAIVIRLEDYLETLEIGDNIVYSKIISTIQETPMVTNVKECFIKRSTSESWDEIDIGITNDEIPDIGTLSIQLGGTT